MTSSSQRRVPVSNKKKHTSKTLNVEVLRISQSLNQASIKKSAEEYLILSKSIYIYISKAVPLQV
jgi:hypothetical protein